MIRVLIALSALLLVPPAATAPSLTETRHWLERALEQEMTGKGQEQWDWNLIASVTFPLARHHQRHGSPETLAALERTARRLDAVDPSRLPCGELADLYLTGRFLEEAGIPLGRQAERQRLAACLGDAPAFDRTNTLLLACRYGAPVDTEVVRRAADELVATQQEDGAFSDGGRPGYYLTTHAMLALHECGGHDPAVARAAGKLALHLGPFLRQGFLDGLGESLLFLRWVGHPAEEEERYRRAIARWITPDGGLCFTARPGCRAHWHATALLLELIDPPRSGE